MAELYACVRMEAASSFLDLSVQGFDSKLLLFTEHLLSAIGEFEVDDERFGVISESLSRAYKNQTLKPQKQASMLRLQLLLPSAAAPQDKLAFLASAKCSAAGLRARMAQMFPSPSDWQPPLLVEGLLMGNVQRAAAERIFQALSATVALPARGDSRHVSRPLSTRCVRLPRSCDRVLATLSDNAVEKNSAIELYYQIGAERGADEGTSPAEGEGGVAWDSPLRMRTLSLLDLLEVLLCEAFFDELRTKQQLGYHVEVGARRSNGVLGLAFCIQSAVKTPPELLERIEAFVETIPALLKAADFEAHKESLIASKTEKDPSLGEEAEHHFHVIRDGRDDHWWLNREEAEDIAAVELQEVAAFAQTHLSAGGGARRRVCVMVFGTGNADARAGARARARAGAHARADARAHSVARSCSGREEAAAELAAVVAAAGDRNVRSAATWWAEEGRDCYPCLV